MMARNAATHWRPLLITCRKQAISLRTGLLVKSRYYANHYDESLFPLEIVGDYFLAKEEQ